jgi:hypothetical protein
LEDMKLKFPKLSEADQKELASAKKQLENE